MEVELCDSMEHGLRDINSIKLGVRLCAVSLIIFRLMAAEHEPSDVITSLEILSTIEF